MHLTSRTTYDTERGAEVLSSDDDNDKNGVVENSKTIEPVASYSEALVLLEKLACMNGTSSKNIDILFLLREKIEELKVQSKKTELN